MPASIQGCTRQSDNLRDAMRTESLAIAQSRECKPCKVEPEHLPTRLAIVLALILATILKCRDHCLVLNLSRKIKSNLPTHSKQTTTYDC
ncbi:MAG TPA: hypothetical protein V6C91_19075 [Coleofasciculaceae cyanobacterium]